MKPKEINYEAEAREKLRNGVNKLVNAVKVTMGAKGRLVFIHQPYGQPIVTKDGVTVAREIFLEDPVENMGAQVVKGAAAKTAELAGDGTTTASVLAQAFINEGLKSVSAGANPTDLKRGIDKAVKAVVKELDKMAVKVTSTDQIKQIASISANNDEFIGNLIGDAMDKVTYDGAITVEESPDSSTYIDIVEGMKVKAGYQSEAYVTNPVKDIVELEKPNILITNNKIESIHDIVHILNMTTDKPILVITSDISGEALRTLIINKVKGGFKVASVKAPFLGQKRKDILEDIAVITGGVVISEDNGLTFENFVPEMFGKANKVIIKREDTIIIGGEGIEETVKARIENLKAKLDKSNSQMEKDDLRERLSFIAGGVAVLYVGASSEVELGEKRDRIDDAISATRAAVEEGIVAGGGLALLSAKKSLDRLKGDNQDQNIGISIVRNSLIAPVKQILHNAGLGDSDILYQLSSEANTGVGYDVKNDKFVHMIESGIIDPKKVTRVALENAASVASMVLMTECTITNLENNESKN